MSDKSINKTYDDFIVALILLFPVVINSVKIIGNLILLILTFMGIYVLIKKKKSPFKVQSLRLFSWITTVYFLVMLISILQNEGFVDDLYHLGRKLHFILAPLIALSIYKVKLSFDKLLLSIKIGLLFIGVIVVYQSIYCICRPSGMYNANVFGDLVLIMSFFSIVKFIEEDNFSKFLTAISFSLGVYAVILSGNRGTFLMLIVISFLYLLIIFKKYFSGNVKKKLISFVILSVILGVLSTNSKVQSGFHRAYDSLFSSPVSYDVNSSSGMRLEMWLGSIEAIKESPWLGYGYRNANAVVSNYVDKDIKEPVFHATHLHNEYITNLVSAGVIGLIALLVLLVTPLVIFIKGFKNNSESVYSVMGILLCTSYAGIGLTHIAFGEEHVNALYIFFLAILLPRVIQERNHS